VAVEDLRQLPGASLGFSDLTALDGAIQRCLAAEGVDGVDGVVVVQGTDTIEETAYLLDLAHAGPQPIVVTGAMRNPTLAGADGPANLLAAVQTAASPRARGYGVLVVLAEEIHAARRVRKTHTTSVAAFHSPNGGPLGHLVEGQPILLAQLEHRFLLPPPHPGRDPRIAVVTMTFGDDGLLLAGLADRVDGLIVAAFGAGHVPAALVPALAALADRLPVVLASRTGAGATLRSTYAFPGSESDLLNRGLIPAGHLDPLKARLLLRALLAAGANRDTITAAFTAAGGTQPAAWPYPNPPA
jgi:L-asparaginase